MKYQTWLVTDGRVESADHAAIDSYLPTSAMVDLHPRGVCWNFSRPAQHEFNLLSRWRISEF